MVSFENTNLPSVSVASNGVIYIKRLVYIDHLSVTELKSYRYWNFKL